MQLVLATGNAGKVTELTELLKPYPITVIPQSEFEIPAAQETGLSFIENALIKARHCSGLTDLPAVADDSGLAVDALGGAPGIYSARYAGDKANASDNIHKLLGAIASLKGEERKARFHCAIAFVRHANDPTPVVCQGTWEGEILTEAKGSGGFGYDPIFYVPTHLATAAELPMQVKNQISHRALALQAFTKVCQQWFEATTT